jgi:hypothetical protein
MNNQKNQQKNNLNRSSGHIGPVRIDTLFLCSLTIAFTRVNRGKNGKDAAQCAAKLSRGSNMTRRLTYLQKPPDWYNFR